MKCVKCISKTNKYSTWKWKLQFINNYKNIKNKLLLFWTNFYLVSYCYVFIVIPIMNNIERLSWNIYSKHQITLLKYTYKDIGGSRDSIYIWKRVGYSRWTETESQKEKWNLKERISKNWMSSNILEAKSPPMIRYKRG